MFGMLLYSYMIFRTTSSTLTHLRDCMKLMTVRNSVTEFTGCDSCTQLLELKSWLLFSCCWLCRPI